MHIVEQAALIEAPMTRVMEALVDVERLPTWTTVTGQVDNIQGQGAGMSYTWQFQAKQFHFRGRAEVIAQAPNHLICKTTGDIDSIWTVHLTPISPKSTGIRVVVEYGLPNDFVEPLADIMLQQLVTPEVAHQNMQRFKEMVEKQAQLLAES